MIPFSDLSLSIWCRQGVGYHRNVYVHVEKQNTWCTLEEIDGCLVLQVMGSLSLLNLRHKHS